MSVCTQLQNFAKESPSQCVLTVAITTLQPQIINNQLARLGEKQDQTSRGDDCHKFKILTLIDSTFTMFSHWVQGFGFVWLVVILRPLYELYESQLLMMLF